MVYLTNSWGFLGQLSFSDYYSQVFQSRIQVDGNYVIRLGRKGTTVITCRSETSNSSNDPPFYFARVTNSHVRLTQ